MVPVLNSAPEFKALTKSEKDVVYKALNDFIPGRAEEVARKAAEKEFVAKIIAAKEAKKNSDLMIIARTEALIAGLDMNEAIQRARAYEKAGANAILIHSKKNTPEIGRAHV